MTATAIMALREILILMGLLPELHIVRSQPWARKRVPLGFITAVTLVARCSRRLPWDSEDGARRAKVLTAEEARRVAVNIARLLLGKADRD
jgi:hypothetical protein